MAKAPRKKTAYVCQSCGARSPRWFGRCPECGEWNTCVEEVLPDGKAVSRVQQLGWTDAKPLPITAVELLGARLLATRETGDVQRNEGLPRETEIQERWRHGG